MFLNCKKDFRDKDFSRSKKVNTAHVIAQQTDMITCDSEIIEDTESCKQQKSNLFITKLNIRKTLTNCTTENSRHNARIRRP